MSVSLQMARRAAPEGGKPEWEVALRFVAWSPPLPASASETFEQAVARIVLVPPG